MAKRITPGQIRRTNRQQVFQYIYDEKKVSQQDIAYALQLSRPTVAAALTEMEEMGMILKSGYLDSDQIGRKAAAYAIDETFRVAVGVEIMRPRVKFVAADLYGRMLGREIWKNAKPCIHKLSLPDEKILGIGIAIQGLVNADGSEVVYGTILDCTGLKIEVFTRHLPFPCAFVHDPDAAAISEIWCSPELKNAYYLSMSRHLGGSIIYNRRIAIGRDGRSTLFEHIVIRPEGKQISNTACQNTGFARTGTRHYQHRTIYTPDRLLLLLVQSVQNYTHIVLHNDAKIQKKVVSSQRFLQIIISI